MKNTRTLSTVAAAAIVVVGIVPATSGNLGTNFAMFFGDSPIDISDGSIHADVTGLLKIWTQKKPGEVYTATAYNPDNITLTGFTDSSGAPSPSPIQIQDTGGWRVDISNAVPGGGNINRDSVTVCSTEQDTPTPSCCSTASDPHPLCLLTTPGSWAYFETHPGRHGKWTLSIFSLLQRLSFQDTRPGCGTGNCDNMSLIRIETMKTGPGLPGPNGLTYTCNKPEDCKIRIGQEHP